MFSNLIRQQARLALSTRLTAPLHHSQKSLLVLTAAQKSQILSQRTFSISRSLFDETGLNDLLKNDPPKAEVKVDEQAEVKVDEQAEVKVDEQAEVKVDEQAEAVDVKEETSAQAKSTRESEGRRQTTLYVANLPYSTEEREIREIFAPYGEVRRVTFGVDADGRQRGYAFVEFASYKEANAIVRSAQDEPFVIFDRNILVRYPKHQIQRRQGEKIPMPTKQLGQPNNTIHIANWPKPGDHDSLRELLKEYENHIVRTHFMRDIAGNFTQKAFIQFTELQHAVAALEAFQEKHVHGTNLKIYYAKERSRVPQPERRSDVEQIFDA